MSELSKERFLLQKIRMLWKTGAYLYASDGSLLAAATFDQEDLKREIIENTDADMVAQIRSLMQSRKDPLIFMESDVIYYLSFFVPVSCDKHALCIVGPFAVEPLNIKQFYEFRHRHGIRKMDFHVPCVPIMDILPVLSLLYFEMTGNMMTEGQLLEANKKAEAVSAKAVQEIYQLKHNETEEGRRFSYREELQWCHAIETGTADTSHMKLTPENMEKMKHVGVLSEKDSFKQCEYMLITTICLASRSALKAGVNPYDAYTLSDIYYQKVSRCTNMMELLQLYIEMTQQFSDLVKEYNEKLQRHDIVERCKDYVARHRKDRIEIGEMAKELGINRSYLSRKFKEKEGVTLQEFILDTKLLAAANLLKHSDAPAGEIMDYLGFSSQSYFGERFKQKYGMTPKEYRMKYMETGYDSFQDLFRM